MFGAHFSRREVGIWSPEAGILWVRAALLFNEKLGEINSRFLPAHKEKKTQADGRDLH